MSSSTFSAPKPIEAYLISPLADSLLIGGASIIAFVFFWLFVDKSASIYSISFTAFALSYVVNWPHFLSSYELLYRDYRSLIFQRWSFFWAAIVSPALIVALFVYATLTAKKEIYVFMVQGMYLSVGWHYVKQIYGTALVTSAVQKRYFTKWERVFILLNLYSVWSMSWVSINQSPARYETDGIAYYSLNLPPITMDIAYAFTIVSLLLALGMGVRKYIHTGVLPATASLVSFATIYVWYIPALRHPSYFYLIPFFHSLQYILFVGSYKRNQSRAEAEKNSDPVQQRSSYIKNILIFWGLAAVTGFLAFRTLPLTLDEKFPLNPLFGPTAWMFAIGIFINVHHYFIDNVIWRGDNPYLKEHLIMASQNNIVKSSK